MQFKCYMYGLIPKKGGADDIKDFRPINLASKLYKLLAKIWASKLEKVMSECFCEGRHILDEGFIMGLLTQGNKKL